MQTFSTTHEDGGRIGGMGEKNLLLVSQSDPTGDSPGDPGSRTVPPKWAAIEQQQKKRRRRGR